MRTPPSAQTLPSETSNAVPGPGGTALRALPACALGLIGTPALAAVVPHDGRESLWPTLVIVLMLALMFGVMVLDRRRLPREPTGGDTLRWQTALAFARRHGSVPEREDERLMAARVAYQRIWYALLLWSFLGGFACAALIRPDLSWLPPLGGLLVVAFLAAARVPEAWTYLRVNANTRVSTSLS